MENKLKEFREMLLDNDYPLGIDEILGQIQYLFEDDKEIYKKMDSYMDDFTRMWCCAEKFYKVKGLVDEQFYSEEE